MCRRISVILFLVLVFGGLAIPLAIVGFRKLESRPAFCYSCHEEHPAHAGWLASGAARHHPNCIECHSGPGIAGMVIAQIKGTTHLVRHVTGNYTNPIVRANVPNQNCEQCHALDRIAREHRRISNFSARLCAECHNHKLGSRFGEGEGDD